MLPKDIENKENDGPISSVSYCDRYIEDQKHLIDFSFDCDSSDESDSSDCPNRNGSKSNNQIIKGLQKNINEKK